MRKKGTKTTDFNIMNTPNGKDIVRQRVKAYEAQLLPYPRRVLGQREQSLDALVSGI